ncbi:MAG: hypothetical protein RBG13Loki_2127 [Promethearchaeota archaeon CR_4]|nr:MAG: hypothetical protein RBG13Loki_2127 [Candidatus Lokiarchaeota archaeon CR_4]
MSNTATNPPIKDIRPILAELPSVYAYPGIMCRMMAISLAIIIPITLREIFEGNTGPDMTFSLILLGILAPLLSLLVAIFFLKPKGQESIAVYPGCSLILTGLMTGLPMLTNSGTNPFGGVFLIFGLSIFANIIAMMFGIGWIKRRVVSVPLRKLQECMLENNLTEVPLNEWVGWQVAMRIKTKNASAGNESKWRTLMEEATKYLDLLPGFHWDYRNFLLRFNFREWQFAEIDKSPSPVLDNTPELSEYMQISKTDDFPIGLKIFALILLGVFGGAGLGMLDGIYGIVVLVGALGYAIYTYISSKKAK